MSCRYNCSMTEYPYCRGPLQKGLTCSTENLVLLRRLAEDLRPENEHIETLYQCKVCQGLYKYIYVRSYQPRNFDQEEGWVEYEDTYYKVGERNEAGSIKFPLAEARIYGWSEQLTVTLHTPDQLPDLPGEELVFIWDQLEWDSLVLYGEQVVWRETTGWEVFERFAEIVDILKRKYGPRLVDVVPTMRSEYALYGDAAKAWYHVQNVRKSLGTSGLV